MSHFSSGKELRGFTKHCDFNLMPMHSHQLNTFSEFLSKAIREDVKIKALQELLGLTGSKEGCSLIEDTNIPKLLLEYLQDENEIICKTACLCLVNISASESGASKFLSDYSKCSEQEIIARLLKLIIDPNGASADAACMTLSNLTRELERTLSVTNYLMESSFDIDQLISAFTEVNFNTKGCNLNYLGPLFANLSQSAEFRNQLMNKDKYRIQRLLPFTQFEGSVVRRNGIAGTLRNCCFESSYHEWLLGKQVDILPHLLLPLAGPEQFSEEDNEKLPFDLQYLDEDKKREPDSQIRKMLLEAIHQLCATKHGREFLRDKNTYVVLREYHKWEEDRSVLLACENVVDILIRTEEEINEDNLKELHVPESYAAKFEEMDRQYLQD